MELPATVSIRAAALADLDAIVALWIEMMREHETFDSRVRLAEAADEAYEHYARHYLTRDDAPVFVAEHDGRIIGFCLGYCARNLPMFRPTRYGFLSDIVVSPRWRGRGIGTALVEAVKRDFREQGIRHIQLQVYTRNERGRTFWRKCGFDDFVSALWFDLE